MNRTVKITSGKFRGRILEAPGGDTHPMGERERLALFNMISGYLPGATVLDAFAGSGALGFEALSRGAKEVLFVDSSPKAENCIIDNMMSLGYFAILNSRPRLARDMIRYAEESGFLRQEKVDVVRKKVLAFKTDLRFDLILADPPYDRFNLSEVKHLVQFLKIGGIFVLSHPGEVTEIPHLKLQKTRKYAGAIISIFVKE